MRDVVFDQPAGHFHALTAGEGDRRILYLHGFPDHPPTAVPFLNELVAHGHHVLAPWLRGYAPSPRVAPYDPISIFTDLRGLIESWSPDTPVDVVGHDWGAVATYVLCITSPARIRRAVTLAVPHYRTFIKRLRNPRQLRASWYMTMFQLPGAGALVRRNNLALIDQLWRTWSPNYTLPAAEREALHATLRASLPAPLEYYRDTRRNMRAVLELFKTPISTPLLALHGADDGCVLPPPTDDARYFTGEYKREVLPGLGHFMQQEAPVAIADRVARWLTAERSPRA